MWVYVVGIVAAMALGALIALWVYAHVPLWRRRLRRWRDIDVPATPRRRPRHTSQRPRTQLQLTGRSAA
jgi:hypothetical protein